MGFRILIVDDSKDKVDKISKLCQDTGINLENIDIASNTHNARNFLRDVTYDIAIVDLALPHFESDIQIHNDAGLKLLEEINYRTETYRYPKNIIAISAFENLSSAQKMQFENLFVKILHYNESDDGWQSILRRFISNILRAQESSANVEYGVDVCIITALPAELTPILDLPWSFSEEKALDDVGYYWEGSISKNDRLLRVVATHSQRMGLVPAAVIASRMISRFRPKILIMPGICGGISGACRLGDVVMANPSWDWQSGKLVLDGDDVRFEGDPHQILVAQAIVSKFEMMIRNDKIWEEIRSKWQKNAPHDIPTGKIGPVASGAAVLADGITVREIKSRQQRKLTAIDMEIFGIYATAHYFSSPQPKTFALKAVSDLADADKGDDWQSYAFQVSAWTVHYFIVEYLFEYIEDIKRD